MGSPNGRIFLIAAHISLTGLLYGLDTGMLLQHAKLFLILC